MRHHLIAFFVVIAAAAANAAPPIACRAAKTEIERAVCGSPEYLAMDREIAALFDRGLAVGEGAARQQLVERQRAFLHKREGCTWAAHHSAHPGVAVDECIRATMEARVAALRRFVDSGGH